MDSFALAAAISEKYSSICNSRIFSIDDSPNILKYSYISVLETLSLGESFLSF